MGGGKRQNLLIKNRTQQLVYLLKEAIWITNRDKNNMNKDEGAYKSINIYDQLILKRQPRSDDVTSTANKRDCTASVQNRVNKVLKGTKI